MASSGPSSLSSAATHRDPGGPKVGTGGAGFPFNPLKRPAPDGRGEDSPLARVQNGQPLARRGKEMAALRASINGRFWVLSEETRSPSRGYAQALRASSALAGRWTHARPCSWHCMPKYQG
jgi:hypothetical protein